MILVTENLRKKYLQGDAEIEVLRGIDLKIRKGETLSIVGPSGGGKSTLLSILSGVDRPSTGKVIVDGVDLGSLSDDALTSYRGRAFGIVFQQFHLIGHLTALENVMLPLEILNAAPRTHIQEKARALLDEVGLGSRQNHRPDQLSGGEAQRVAIARALVTQPKILLADEPSGNLDIKTGEQVMDLLFDLVKRHQSTLILVTHSLKLASRCERSYALESGRLTEIAHSSFKERQ